ncbi:MAG: prolipoprotein diacylglyceryl transferase [Ardenticatenaceae bacterium]|nr:prolipoprotein diacylglyceryl transferase [Ardenticatenaceae bacterium]HBY93666.1 prolipoprotein diacylglyceryl transferase [Chloroflexota bacterium]
MNPIAIQIGPIALRWYGLLIVTGALVGAWISAGEARRRGKNPDHVWDMLVFGLLAGILGGRLYHVISSPAGTNLGWHYYFVEHPFTMIHLGSLAIPFPSALAIWEGGLGIYGGILGGALAVWIYTRRHHLNLLRWLDIGAYGLIAGQAIGRWGNFFNQELYGNPTTLPWGIPIDAAHRLPQFANLPLDTRFHPTFLYESLWDFFALAVMLWIGRRFTHRLRNGDIALLYLILYPLGRFLVEFQRPDAWTILGFPTAQWIALILIVAASLTLWWRHREPIPPDERSYPDLPTEVPKGKARKQVAKVTRGR